MRDLAVLVLHLLATVARLAGPGGARAVVAESVLLKQQLLMFNRSRRRACGSPKDRPHVVGAISGDSDRSAKGILDAHPIGFRTRNV